MLGELRLSWVISLNWGTSLPFLLGRDNIWEVELLHWSLIILGGQPISMLGAFLSF
jgi:hypothetical protein